MATDDVLRNPVWGSLTTTHTALAERNGLAARFAPDVSPFGALADADDPRAWADMAVLAGAGGRVLLAAARDTTAPPDWEIVMDFPGVQMVDVGMEARPDAEAVVLGAADVPEMLDLVARTDPGPFERRTVQLGTYLGIRRAGRLIAMAGERAQPPGWTEISAVCTDPAHRGEGLATRLVRAVAANVRGRGETPFLHTAQINTRAIRLYVSLGFEVSRETFFRVWRVPE